MCTNSRINNVTNSCLAHIALSAACCVRAAAVVAAQWRSMLQFSACGAAAPGGGAGLQPGEPLKKFHGRPVIGALASLGGMGKQGVAIESGCCRSTGRVPVIEQSENESANEALVTGRAGHLEPRI